MTTWLNHTPESLQKISTLVTLLQHRALHQPNQIAFTFLKDGENEAISLTYQQLERQARSIAVQLYRLKATGKRVLLLYPSGLEFIAAFFGCLYAGAVAVPAYLPRPNQSLMRLQAIVTDAQASLVLTTASQLHNIKDKFGQNSELTGLQCLATDNLKTELASEWQEPNINSDTLAFLQYTSGSIGMPKGVMATHANLLHNQQMIERAFGHTEKTIIVGWLPFYHDMGLIGNVLQPLYLGRPAYLMSPMAFLQKPLCWLQAISRYKATTSGGPNFAYDLCVRKSTPEQRATLDLSSWLVAFNGAETVWAETLEQFAAAFDPCGFRREAFYPCYGMAEATLFITGGLTAQPPRIQAVKAEALAHNKVVIADKLSDNRNLVSCGHARGNQDVRIVDPKTCIQCPDRQVGEIWVAGESVAQGYWNLPEQTAVVFQARLANTGEGPFLRTGDLGFLQAGELFVTGRLKDVIIIRGRNHYPQDIERTVEKSNPLIRPSCCAAFSVEVAGEEKLVVVAEVERRYITNHRQQSSNQVDEVEHRSGYDHRRIDIERGFEPNECQRFDREAAIAAIRAAVSEQHELEVYAVLLIKPGSIPKTSSGKIQRYACRTRFLENSLDIIDSWKVDELLRQPRSTSFLTSLATNFDTRTDDMPPSRQMETPASPENEYPESGAGGGLYSVESIQNRIVDWLSRRLRITATAIDTGKSLAHYGLDSLVAVELTFELEKWLERPLKATVFWNFPTIKSLARYLVEEGMSAPTSPDPWEQGFDSANRLATRLNLDDLDLKAEATLDPTTYLQITSSKAKIQQLAKSKNILLTGATGFLGAFLLRELLEQTKANIYCLVRSSNAEAGKTRIKKTLKSYGIWAENFSDRIISIVGDLSQPMLGLSAEHFQHFSYLIDIIYHNGALLNFVYPYSVFKAINVLGTQEILRLASLGKVKPVHYISTVAVFESTAYAGKVVTESDQLVHSKGINMGYSQSKWVAEKLVMAARDRGLPVAIYRPSLISGHSQTGVWNTDDFTCRMIKGCIQLGSMAELDYSLDISPVDYVSRSIIYLSQQKESLGKAFHLNNPHPMHWQHLVDWLCTYGYSICRLPYEKWQAELSQTQTCKENPIYPLLPFLLNRNSEKELIIPSLYHKNRIAKIDCQQTLKALVGSNLVCHPVDSKLMSTYFSYFIRIGFLAAP